MRTTWGLFGLSSEKPKTLFLRLDKSFYTHWANFIKTAYDLEKKYEITTPILLSFQLKRKTKNYLKWAPRVLMNNTIHYLLVLAVKEEDDEFQMFTTTMMI